MVASLELDPKATDTLQWGRGCEPADGGKAPCMIVFCEFTSMGPRV